MFSMPRRLVAGIVTGTLALCASMCSSESSSQSSPPVGTTSAAVTGFPQYDHVFVIINENHGYGQIIGNSAAPIINALATDYGLATQYTGVGDPSEPNYVAMLGGDTFGIASDDPYFFPGQTVDVDNLMSQLEQAGKTWGGYFEDLPYAGYRGYCYPAKCNGIPDSDTQYVAKHNGIVNFANMQVPAEFAKQMPLAQLSDDLATDNLPNFGYIVADECHDMHGAPPWCVDSGNPGDVDDVWLISQGDKFVGKTVDKITSSKAWATGNTAVVVTFDEGNAATSRIVTVVVTNHGPRGVKDHTPYNHYSLLASLQQTFGLGCLVNSCAATPMAPLLQITGANDVPTLPAPFKPAPNGSDAVSAQGTPVKGSALDLTGTGWFQVASPSLGGQDNNLAAVSAASASDVWAVGSYLPPTNKTVLAALAEHFDGKRWTAYPLPDVGLNENSLLAVSMLPSGNTWAVGYFVNSVYKQKTLVEHFDGTTWSVVSSPSPGDRQNILYGVVAIADDDVWAVGAEQDASALWHTLSEHWDGNKWSVVPTVDAGSSGNQFYAVTAVSSSSVYATGQQGGAGFPNEVLTERWDGSAWSVLPTPAASDGSPVPLGVSGTDSALAVVGDFETSAAPYTTFVAAGAPNALSAVSTPNNGAGENDLFATTTGHDGSTWAVGWYIDASSGNHHTLVEQGVNGQWSLVSSPSPGTGDSGLAGITAVPGGGLWAVGVTTRTNGNFETLVLYRP
jgi:Phosphoesterase family